MSKIHNGIKFVSTKKSMFATLLALVVVVFSIGLVAGTHIEVFSTGEEIGQMNNMGDARDSGDKFTSPLLDCSDLRPPPAQVISRLREESARYIDEVSDVAEVSIYFRALQDGGWYELGEKELFQPASLMKIPIVIAAYVEGESSPEFMDRKISPLNSVGVTQNIVTEPKAEEEEKMTMRELVFRSLVHSDNDANFTISETVGKAKIDEVLKDFGVPYFTTSITDYHVSPRVYSSLFRILYNATYLSEENSEEILSMLSKSTFDKGLVAGLPRGVKVAHKFGERVFQEAGNSQNSHQLHDCGIIYAKRPYILCIMTKSSSFDPLYKILSDLSELTFNLVQES